MKKKKESRGRKPIDDKKLRVELYIRESVITTVGGKEEINKIANAAIMVNYSAKMKQHGKKHSENLIGGL